MTAIRRAFVGPVTLGAYVLLVVPFALAWIDSRLHSPLALPGYLIYGIGTSIGNAISPRLAFWVYWGPFLVGCYVVAVTVGVSYEGVRSLVVEDTGRRL